MKLLTNTRKFPGMLNTFNVKKYSSFNILGLQNGLLNSLEKYQFDLFIHDFLNIVEIHF